MFKSLKDVFLYFFCYSLGILRVKTFIVLPNKEYKQVKLKIITNIIIIDGETYKVNNSVAQIVNKTLMYYWINLEEFPDNNKPK